MRIVQFAREQFYHVFNRGVEKRTIFEDQADFRRFYTSMFLFNDIEFRNPGGHSSLRDEEIQRLLETGNERKRFVNIVSYCLLPNHFHLMLEQLEDDGIQKFMHRLGMGYARYFNKRYERSGRFYEGTFKAVHIARDTQFSHLPRYIHLNALDLTEMPWRDGKVADWGRAEQFLDAYPWSSHHVYVGRPQSLEVVHLSTMRDHFPTAESYRSFLREWSGRFKDYVS